jgi:hypothetical protein
MTRLLNQFAIRNSQFAITFCNGDLTPTQNVLPIEAGDLNPQSLLKSLLLKIFGVKQVHHWYDRYLKTHNF